MMLIKSNKADVLLFGTVANSIGTDKMPQNAASRLGLNCLLIKILSKNKIQMKNYP